ncbi:MAG: twin-arginine translocation signal domain-containing protein, partial [Gemmatimonadetes bacterium]|nr:twin-arginine translocation signal domain-containing protein [Gemmatimonadota bacterium]
MDTDRRSFLRTVCASGICGCFGAAAATDPAHAALEQGQEA